MRNLLKLVWLLSILTVASSCGEDGKTKYVQIPGVPPPADGPITPPNPVPSTPEFVSFDAFESENLTDATSLASDEQRQARYITACDLLNSGIDITTIKRGVQKAVNQISLERRIEPGVWIGQNKCTLRILLDDYGLTPQKWRLIEQADPLDFESFTDRGLLLKQLTQSRRPWIQASNFLETSLNNSTYYALLEVPNNLQAFLVNYVGCDIQGDFDNFSRDLFMVGVRRSLIALQKNRSLLVTECQEGTFSLTFDTIQEAVTSPGRSLSINPFPVEARTNKDFQQDASEAIFTLSNGLQGYALFNAAGLLEVFAPTNIVVDNVRPDIDATIRNARSCSSCHVNGFIEADDFVAGHVTGNPNFNNDEIQKGQFFFGRNAGMRAVMRQANQLFEQALSQLNVSVDSKDPINQLTDKIRRVMTPRMIAGMFFMRESEFLSKLRQSPGGSLALGQLLQGEGASFQDVILAKDVLIRDLNLFQEDLGG